MGSTIGSLNYSTIPPPGSVNNAALQPAIVSNANLQTNSVGLTDLQQPSVSGNVISADTVTFLKGATLGPNTVGNSILQSAAVSGNVIATQSILPSQLNPECYTLNKNAIINGNMNIWQRLSGSGFTGISNAVKYGPDRFSYSIGSTAGTVKMEQDFGVVPTGSASSVKISQTTTAAVSGTNSAGYSQLVYNVEGYDLIPFKNQVCTLSFWVYTNCPGVYAVSFRNGFGDSSYVHNFTITTANTWQKIVTTFTLNTATGTWKFDNTAGMVITINFAVPNTYQAPQADTWVPGFFFATTSGYAGNSNGTVNYANQNGFTYGNGNFMNITQMQLELGDTPTPFQYVPFQQDLAKCQRYCYRFNNSQAAVGPLLGNLAALNQAYALVQFPVSMRTNPTAIPSPAAPTISTGAITGAQIGVGNFRLAVNMGGGTMSFSQPQTSETNCFISVNSSSNYTGGTGPAVGDAVIIYLGQFFQLLFNADY